MEGQGERRNKKKREKIPREDAQDQVQKYWDEFVNETILRESDDVDQGIKAFFVHELRIDDKFSYILSSFYVWMSCIRKPRLQYTTVQLKLFQHIAYVAFHDHRFQHLAKEEFYHDELTQEEFQAKFESTMCYQSAREFFKHVYGRSRDNTTGAEPMFDVDIAYLLQCTGPGFQGLKERLFLLLLLDCSIGPRAQTW